MKRAKLQVIVRMVSRGLPAEQMLIENEFSFDEAKKRYLALIRQVFVIAKSTVANIPSDHEISPSFIKMLGKSEGGAE